MKLPPAALYIRSDLKHLGFDTTESLTPSANLRGQSRAISALHLGSKARAPSFNMFVIGTDKSGMLKSIEDHLRDLAEAIEAPSEWVYVNNFAEPHKPTAIELPPGRSPAFRDRMHDLVQDLNLALPAAFESKDYQSHREAVDNAARERQEKLLGGLRERALKRNLAVLRTPLGFGLAPLRNGQILSPEEFNALREGERNGYEASMREFEPEVEQTIRTLPQLDRQHRSEIRDLDRQTAQVAIGELIDDVKRTFDDLPQVLRHLEAVHHDLVDNVALFILQTAGDSAHSELGGPFDRYEVNVLVARPTGATGAPVVVELHPTLGNLTGRVEHLAQQGNLVTNFRLIKPGDLHLANAGFLLIDAQNLLAEPYSWQALKRALSQGYIKIEDLSHMIGLTSTVSLEPDPIPLRIRIVLFGTRRLYYLLSALDPELANSFKVLVDFEDEIERTKDTEEELACWIAAFVRKQAVRHIERSGVERLVEYAARVAADQAKLSLVDRHLEDLIVEADFWAGEGGLGTISRQHIEAAIEKKIWRSNRAERRHFEAIYRRLMLIDIEGRREGQINGLSYIELGDYAFGAPVRITCRARPGSGKIVDIEREVELGGQIHSKGVLVLSGFLAGRYALTTSMSLFASIVLEQSYSGVEGDSASAAELCALLSAISEIPIRQNLALTGSVNQHGVIQAIGGVNEKIEGFFEICRSKGLTGDQAVLIPSGNIQHLMLREDVQQACAQDTFTIYSVSTIDECMELLTGVTAGARDQRGTFPDGSINRRVEDRLIEFEHIRRKAAGLGEESART